MGTDDADALRDLFAHRPQQWGKTLRSFHQVTVALRAVGETADRAAKAIHASIAANDHNRRAAELRQQATAALGRGDKREHRRLMTALSAHLRERP